METKQVLVVRKDLNMRKGKIAAQCAHASMKILLDRCSKMEVGDSYYLKFFVAKDSPLQRWLEEGFRKIVVYVDSEAELEEIYLKAMESDAPCAMIVDSGFTEFKGVPTKTVVAIGPWTSDVIDKITSHLKLM